MQCFGIWEAFIDSNWISCLACTWSNKARLMRGWKPGRLGTADWVDLMFVVLRFSPAVLATVLLRDPVFILAPNVHSWENQRHQYGEAAHQGKDHNALLLRLQDREKGNKIDFLCVSSAPQHFCKNEAKVLQPWLPLAGCTGWFNAQLSRS